MRASIPTRARTRASTALPVYAICLALPALAPSARADTAIDSVVSGLTTRPTYVEPLVQGFVRQRRLDYAARIASRAADGRPIVVAFVQVPDGRIDFFRDELYQRLGLARRGGALIVATPTALTMRTANLTPDAELAIIHLDQLDHKLTAHMYTEPLAELVYDTGLVIHNTTPGSHARGSGLERNLDTFPGRFSDEPVRNAGGGTSGSVPWLPIVAAFFIPVVAASALAARSRRRRRSAN